MDDVFKTAQFSPIDWQRCTVGCVRPKTRFLRACLFLCTGQRPGKREMVGVIPSPDNILAINRDNGSDFLVKVISLYHNLNELRENGRKA
jgi:hypothetical protein